MFSPGPGCVYFRCMISQSRRQSCGARDVHTHTHSYTASKGSTQVVRQVWSVRYQGELLGLQDTLKIVIFVENYPQKRPYVLCLCYDNEMKTSNVCKARHHMRMSTTSTPPPIEMHSSQYLCARGQRHALCGEGGAGRALSVPLSLNSV